MEFTVPEQYSGISLKNFLRRECSVSARLLAKLRRTPDGISVNGKFAITTQLLRGGDKVTLRLPPDDTDIIPIRGPCHFLQVCACHAAAAFKIGPAHIYHDGNRIFSITCKLCITLTGS